MDAAERDRLGRNEPTVYNQIGTSLFYGGFTAEALDCFRRSTAVSDTKGLFAGLQGLALTAGTLAVVPAWCALTWLHADGPNGHRWLLTSLAAIWAADTGAYFAGRYLGRHKLAPRISPNKTVEGLLGGVVIGTIIAMLFSRLADASLSDLPKVAIVAAASILVSVVGDLFESLLKRHAGKKDSGTLIPGHGGVLDRIDAVLAALPVFALGKALLGF